MKYRQLGSLTVSEIGLGCSGFWGHRQFDDPQAIRIVHEAFDLGINLFDTGHNYCNYNAEPRLGRALAEILKRSDRSKIVVSTKAGTLRPRPLLSLREVKTQDHSPDYIERACAQAIKNLNAGFIDIFYLHNFSPASITDELLTKLAAMRRNGMFRLLGINTHSEAHMQYVAQLKGVFDVALIDLNVAQLDRLPVVEQLHKAGIAVVAGTVLAQGHLIRGKIGHIRSAADLWYLARALLKPDARRLALAARDVRPALAAVEGLSAAQAAMSYILGLPQVSACIFGTTNLKNLREIAAAPEKRLSEAHAASIYSAFRQQRTFASA
ncbi:MULTISPECIES: aldo/keto reductase [Bradyrhizobium]|jgi:aryl-alcohol dehydrogenase-like predicted oxidoreductase|uniref:aldo/keto reductase n=1 Tax=Bradyrhizobium TaxID=374 RepID=UPI0003AAD442|nr:aldo/keto reductase [Bradyrhizobium denitrificans]MCL8484685.1 aldo/keto reductase [Bradyrhizobium denitrificans]RTM03160.1 MAG: aldo/keto reductase [Bradyrhizobiaceae bacterium]